MHLCKIMTPEVEVIHSEVTLPQAAATMHCLNISSLPVCEGERLIVCARSGTSRSGRSRRGAIRAPPRSVRPCPPDSASCLDDQGSADAQAGMERYPMRRVPMLTRDKRLVGMVSLDDLAVRSDTPTQAGETLQHVALRIGAAWPRLVERFVNSYEVMVVYVGMAF